MSGKPLSERAKNMVLNAVAFFEAEKREKQPIIPFERVHDRVCAALGISPATVSQIIKEGKAGPVKPPKLKRDRPKSVTNIDEFLQSAIRKTVDNLHEEKKSVTVMSILSELKEKDLFHGSRSSLLKILNDMQFDWKRENKKRPADFQMVLVPGTPEFFENENADSNQSSTSQEIKMNLVTETSSTSLEFQKDVKTEPSSPSLEFQKDIKTEL